MYYYYVRVAKKVYLPSRNSNAQEHFLPQNSFYKYEYCIHDFYISNKISHSNLELAEINMNQVFLNEIHTIEKVHYNVEIILKLLIEV